MGKLENNIMFNKKQYSLHTSSYMHIKTEENIYTLFNDSYSFTVIRRNYGATRVRHGEIYYLYKNGKFLKSFALKTFLKRLDDKKLKEIIEEDFILKSSVTRNRDFSFMDKKRTSKRNSIIKNSHIFDKRITNPYVCYTEAILLFKMTEELN